MEYRYCYILDKKVNLDLFNSIVGQLQSSLSQEWNSKFDYENSFDFSENQTFTNGKDEILVWNDRCTREVGISSTLPLPQYEKYLWASA